MKKAVDKIWRIYDCGDQLLGMLHATSLILCLEGFEQTTEHGLSEGGKKPIGSDCFSASRLGDRLLVQQPVPQAIDNT